MATSSSGPRRYALKAICRSAPGQVAAAAAWIERHDGYVDEFSVHDDRSTGRFFLRAVFRRPRAMPSDFPLLREDLKDVASGMQAVHWRLYDLAQPMRVLLMVSRHDHCLADILNGWKQGEMPMRPVAVASNHNDLRPLAEAHGLPFHHWPVAPATRHAQEEQLLRLVESAQVDVVVLARYMQALSDETCTRLAGRVVNIHHGLLPAFKGARPYHQAFERGVKLIGATSHFATPDMGEGPIIDQATASVTHAQGPDDLLAVGRRLECTVLSRALRSVLEHRVFINGNRTVVLR